MKCTLIFDHLNDITFIKHNKKFAKHIINIAIQQKLMDEPEIDNHLQHTEISSNVIMQIFSPIVTSQRIMNCQFGNSYRSIQCHDGLNMVFNEYMGYLFVQIGSQSVEYLNRLLGICISFVRHLCGPDLHLLKNNESRKTLLSRLLAVWEVLRKSDQAVLVEAVEQLMVNTDMGSATLKSLQEVVEKLRTQGDVTRAHAMILVQNKFLSLYSSPKVNELSASDIIFVSLLTVLSLNKDVENMEDSTCQFDSPTAVDSGITSELVLLMGKGALPACIPHQLHIVPLADHVCLLLIIELGNNNISTGLYEIFHHFNTMQVVQMQKESDQMRPILDHLDTAVKKTLDALKKVKYDDYAKKLSTKWDTMRKKYQELLKTNDPDCALRIESSTQGFIDTLRELLDVAVFNAQCPDVKHLAEELAAGVHTRLASFNDFLKVKAIRNFTLESYLEEFPGLVHFLYVDRSNHRVTAPSLDFTSEETVNLTKQKIWSMVEFVHNHLQNGHLAFMWKDTTFNYSYFIWFEDSAGVSLKPKQYPTNTSALPMPGILTVDFYKKLTELCFPKQTLNKIRCFELFCIHLGLVSSSCVLEHSRRLGATIWDITGGPNNPVDLL